MQPLFDLVRPYWPTLLFFVVFPVLAAALNWALWWDTPERWDAFVAAHPKRAQWVRVLRAVAPHLRKLLTVARDGAASKGAPQAVELLSPRAVSRDTVAPPAPTSPEGFDAAQRQTIAPDVVAAAQAATRDGQPGYATVRALLAVVVTLTVVLPLGAIVTSCGPRLPPVSGCQPEAQTCINDAPHVCSASQRWHRAGDISCSAVGGVCAVANGRAYCAPLTDGGVR
jgi:hypothetical protein